MRYAFWPGCVSKGAAPELYQSMVKVAPAARHRARRAVRRQLHGRRRDQRAQHGDGGRPERPQLRDGAAPGPAADQHLQHLPGRAVAGPGPHAQAPRAGCAGQRRAGRRGPVLRRREGPGGEELPLGARRGHRPGQAQEHGEEAADRPQGGPVLRLLHPAPGSRSSASTETTRATTTSRT